MIPTPSEAFFSTLLVLQSIEPCRITVENRLLGRRADLLVLAQLTDFFLHGVSVHFMREVRGKDKRSFTADFDRIGQVRFATFDAHHKPAVFNELADIVSNGLTLRQLALGGLVTIGVVMAALG